MHQRSRPVVFFTIFLLIAACTHSQEPVGTMAFTVSIEKPSTHTYHVAFRCEGLIGAAQDFRMPVWSPGYYGIRDFPKNVQNFRAEDGQGDALAWERTANSWRVQTGNAPIVNVTYDVLATSGFVADPYLGEERAYLVGTGVFMYVVGQIDHPVAVEVKPIPEWTSIATGLDPVSPDEPNRLAAPNFDVLYDSPILIGNLESLPSFEIEGVPHHFIGHELGDKFNQKLFMKNLKGVVEQGIAVVGEVPYKHYTFIGYGPGRGGIEHLNSTTIPFKGRPELDTREGSIGQLSFLAHEYFHHYNVKRIRPIALGPFDYDKANPTRMLWVSEGFTSYYGNLMVARAGLMTQEELLDRFRKTIAAYENNTGRLFQSATESSWSTWSQGPFGGRPKGSISKSVSYYSKGCGLGLLFDFKIRHETQNGKSLDTVMQKLYQEYYKKLQRGWTDEEFRAVCEHVAGVSLEELFDYASTTKEIDYDKYLGYAGLELEEPERLPDPYLGAVVEDANGKLVIAAIEGGSPSQHAKLAVNDEIKSLDGARVDAPGLNAAIASKKPGDKIKLTVTRSGKTIDKEVTLANRMQRSFRIIPIAKPDALQSAILKDWMRAR
jgi:predicted metalloprotease with PDZ domain